MTSLIIGPIYLTYEKIKEHRDGKKRIRNAARFEELRREHEGSFETKDEELWRLEQQRMKTGFGLPAMSEDGRVKLSHDWEAERQRQWELREREREQYQRSAAAALRPDRTGNTVKRESWHGDYRSRMGNESEWESGQESPVPRRSLQVSRLGREIGSNDSLSDRSSSYNRPQSDMSRSREYLEPQTTEQQRPREREEEPKDMSSLFVDEILRERGLGR